ncbi:putative pentatricopeptide repeat-containing protein At3g13770, mitochondrial [Andrographis paniculata]|uniref:putative pentatricopeptide repeat-containing protein At3g13770, mitochondrial n=1 Tax=Andrographis paniculata TaxID=175694 RepID=UPI0021E872A5|nr:putative pentatricopeptide repeat-containing protein At3g13770, mitochondrial [Andrographis paniculata]
MEILKELPSTLNWNSLIIHHAKLRNDAAVLATYSQMRSLALPPTADALPLVFKACRNLNAPDIGREIHRSVASTALINDVRVATSLIDFYCKCGCLREAANVFDEMPQRDVVAWNAMVAGCVELTEFDEAMSYFEAMQRVGPRLNARTAVAVIAAAAELMEVWFGKELHAYCLRNGLLNSGAHLATALIGFYSKFDVVSAERVFRMVEVGKSAIWNAMIKGYFIAGMIFEALSLFVRMLVDGVRFDSVTLLVVLQACRESRFVRFGMEVHQQAIKCGFGQNLRVVDALINVYGSLGFVDSAYALFSSVSLKDIALWNTMLSVFVDNGYVDDAVAFFGTMQLVGVNERTLCIVLPLCERFPDGLRNGRSLHAHSIKLGMEDSASVKSVFLNLFGEIGCVESVVRIFNEMLNPEVPSWNTAILTLAGNGVRDRALDLFVKMGWYSSIAPNSHTILSVLAACDDEVYLNLGRSIHGFAVKLGIEIDSPLHTALTKMYLDCNCEAASKFLFERFEEKDLILWNSMIACYNDNNESEKALSIFGELVRQQEPRPNEATIITALSSCTDLANLPAGKSVHAYAMRRLFLPDYLSVSTALVTMYARCGDLSDAELVFMNLPNRNLVSWNAMIAAYGVHGRGGAALSAFSKLLEDGFVPDRITFVSILSACSHSGLVESGLRLYNSMIRDFKITPEAVHCACVVDLLARGGDFNKALEFIDSMEIPPEASAWRSLLGACRVHSATEYIPAIFEKLVELEPANAGNYILVSNIFAAAGKWREVEEMRRMLNKKRLRKPPGKSWIAIRNEIHYFKAGDRSHPQSRLIYEKLEALLDSIGAIGYVPDVSCSLRDEEDEKKLQRIGRHSEKLAVAYGLIRSGRSRSAIRIGKNLRSCEDCHEFCKYVSRLVGREIVLRDGMRFHHFNNGGCSCGDFW